MNLFLPIFYKTNVDFESCFGSFNREALFIIIERNGIADKLLNVIKGIYINISFGCSNISRER